MKITKSDAKVAMVEAIQEEIADLELERAKIDRKIKERQGQISIIETRL